MSTFEKTRDVIADRLGIELERITMDSNLKEDLEIDSLDMAELLIAFEDTLKVRIPDEISNNLKTVRDVVEYIEESFPAKNN